MDTKRLLELAGLSQQAQQLSEAQSFKSMASVALSYIRHKNSSKQDKLNAYKNLVKILKDGNLKPDQVEKGLDLEKLKATIE